tara:strand:+ start:839 stop:1180 length:342 start_codon:yes stop_codon:yes gene_type:complete
MANYSQVIDWIGKDSLPDTDVKKIISGTEFHTEFGQLETVITSKADINGSASEAFSTSKAATNSDTTISASTSWVRTRMTADNALRTNGLGIRTISTGNATGGANGDIHYKVS